jgi:hypothetical protein
VPIAAKALKARERAVGRRRFVIVHLTISAKVSLRQARVVISDIVGKVFMDRARPSILTAWLLLPWIRDQAAQIEFFNTLKSTGYRAQSSIGIIRLFKRS